MSSDLRSSGLSPVVQEGESVSQRLQPSQHELLQPRRIDGV